MKKTILASLIAATAVFAADQTHYDLIRPVYPMTWDDTSSVENGGTVYSFSKFTPPSTTKESARLYPADGAKPVEFKPNGIISDTLDQAFIDALSLSISDIRVNQAGYLPSDPEQLFYYFDKSGNCTATYSVVDTDGKEVAKGGTLTSTERKAGYIRDLNAYRTSIEKRYTVSDTIAEKTVCKGNLVDMAGLPTNKRLRIKVGKELSSTFIISDEVYSMVRDASLKFLGAQRSGNSESWFHGPSHMKDGDGKLTGGWYDAGDHIKGSSSMGYTLMALSVLTATEPALDDDHYAYNHNEVEKTDGIPDILREAKYGAEFYLRSFAYADGDVSKMVVGIGDSEDHNVWLRCDSMDNYAYAPSRKLLVEDLVPPIAAQIAAGLALLSKTYADYDKTFADSCLMVAEKLYELGKSSKDDPFEYSYNVNGGLYRVSRAYDDLAVAAIALHYATYEKSKKKDYLNDAVYDTSIVNNINAKYDSLQFKAGWFGNTSGFIPGGWLYDYDNVHNFALYAFYKLILVDEKTSEKFGIDKEERLRFIEKILFSFARSFTDVSSRDSEGATKIDLSDVSEKFSLNYDDLDFSQFAFIDFAPLYYDAAELVGYLMYERIAEDLDDSKIKLPNMGTGDWKAVAIRQLVLNRMNYILGMNEWDMSFMIGVGDKNESHIHHRTSNPELSNLIVMPEFEKRKQEMMDTLDLSKYTADEIKKLEDDLWYELETPTYSYRPLTGVLMGGPVHGAVYSDVEKFLSTDVVLWGNVDFLAALMLLSKEQSAAAPDTSKKDSSDVKAIPELARSVPSLNVEKFGAMLEVNYSLPQAASATVKLISVTGNVVRKFNGGNLGSGNHTVRFDMSEVPAGVYIIKVNAGSMSKTKVFKFAE